MDRALFIVRHGEAVSSATSDALRELTSRGAGQVTQMAEHLAETLRESFGCPACDCRLFSSPFVRARQTAEIISRPTGIPLQICEKLTPDVSSQEAVDALFSLSGESRIVVVVSHMPLVSALLGQYLSGSDWAGRSFATGECVQLRLADFLPGCGTEVRSFR